jgi:hypothetical protein
MSIPVFSSLFSNQFIQTVVHIRLKTLRRFAAQFANMNRKFVQRIAKEVEDIKASGLYNGSSAVHRVLK